MSRFRPNQILAVAVKVTDPQGADRRQKHRVMTAFFLIANVGGAYDSRVMQRFCDMNPLMFDGCRTEVLGPKIKWRNKFAFMKWIRAGNKRRDSYQVWYGAPEPFQIDFAKVATVTDDEVKQIRHEFAVRRFEWWKSTSGPFARGEVQKKKKVSFEFIELDDDEPEIRQAG